MWNHIITHLRNHLMSIILLTNCTYSTNFINFIMLITFINFNLLKIKMANWLSLFFNLLFFCKVLAIFYTFLYSVLIVIFLIICYFNLNSIHHFIVNSKLIIFYYIILQFSFLFSFDLLLFIYSSFFL
jgi:hypothetical protein